MTTDSVHNPARSPGQMGRHPAKRLAMAFAHSYTTLPAPVYPVDVSGGITDWQMLGNDRYGDCAWAGETHYEMATAAAGGAGPAPVPTARDEADAYLLYNHGQDIGANLADALLYWYRAGKILGFAPVDHTDPVACDSALATFRGLYCGVNLTGNSQDLFRAGQPWNTDGGQQPDPHKGHCIVKVKADAATDTWVTWGALQESTKAWTAACIEEAWVIITTEDVAAGVDMAALRADIEALGGTAAQPGTTRAAGGLWALRLRAWLARLV